MKINKTKLWKYFGTAVTIGIIVVIINNIFLHINEERVINNFINDLPFKKEQYSSEREFFHAISDHLDINFNKKHRTWKYINLKNRPFLRQGVSELLYYREGLCGEGARMMVKILHSLGYDATRLAFYGKRFGAAHALVSVIVDGKEIIVDSINYSKDLNEIIRNKNCSMNEIDLVYYDQRFIKKDNYKKTDFAKMFSRKYATYSYEATPYSKLLSVFGINKHIFNYDRPNSFLSYLVESIYLIKVFMWIFIMFLWLLIYFSIKKLLRKID